MLSVNFFLGCGPVRIDESISNSLLPLLPYLWFTFPFQKLGQFWSSSDASACWHTPAPRERSDRAKLAFCFPYLVSRLRRGARGCWSWVPGQAGQERGPGGRHLLLVLGAACSAQMCVKPWPLLFLIFCFHQWLENYIQITTTQVVLILKAIVQHMSWEEAIYSDRNVNRECFSFSLQSI